MIPSTTGSAESGKSIRATRVEGSHVADAAAVVHSVAYGKGAEPPL